MPTPDPAVPPLPAGAAEKAELRRHFQALRDAAAAADRAAWSGRICGHIAALCAARGFRRVGAFAPFRSEVDLRPLQAAQPGTAWLFPRVVSRNPPRLAWGGPPLVPGTWGLLEPADTPYPLPPVQLLLVPGLAFAADGQRLGYGKGFYDDTLAALPGDVVTLAVGFHLQRCERLPAGPMDRPVQGLATEVGITWFR
jgi:5-formyltetrahydrofolate cyclo-ligase